VVDLKLKSTSIKCELYITALKVVFSFGISNVPETKLPSSSKIVVLKVF
jgi:hypothetical protein